MLKSLVYYLNVDTPQYIKRIANEYALAFHKGSKDTTYSDKIGLLKKLSPFESKLVRALGELAMDGYIIEVTPIEVIMASLNELGITSGSGGPITSDLVRVNCGRIIKKIDPDFLSIIFEGVVPANQLVQIGLWYEYIIRDDLLSNERRILIHDEM